MNKKEVLPQQVVPGKTYSFSGDIKNGCYADGTPRISHEEVTREVSYVKDNLIVCVCGRQFIINENLKIQKFPY